jgi:hypothetical protein
MKTTRYFREIVIKKRTYIKIEWIEKILNDPIKTKIQPTGRIRYWGYIEELQKYVRVITLADRETVHNVFPDRNFKE